MSVSSPPVGEKGSVDPQSGGLLAWSQFVDDREYVPELQYPASVRTYDRMLTDTQLKGLMWGSTMPIRRFRWELDPNGARPEVVDALANDLALPIIGSDPRPALRRKGRFSHDTHLQAALRALSFGHYFFEQVGEVRDDGLWHLKKLAPRPPRTIEQIDTERDGGLKSVKQALGMKSVEIPVSRLVAYIWDMEGGQWSGTSMLRSCFRNWLIKDRLMRVDAIAHERSGAGMPVATAPPGATGEQLTQLAEMAREFRVTEEGGGAVPHGTDFKLLGVTGSTSDPVASMRFHNEEMSRAFLMMFMQLGSTETGSRALGSEFIQFFSYAQEGIADWYRDVTNEHVIEDWVDWNYGPDEQQPLLVYKRNEIEELSAADLKMLIDSGALQVDEELEAGIRQRYKLPEKAEASPQSPPSRGAEARRSDSAVAADATPSAPLPLPGRELRRQPYDHEVKAAVDFAAIDQGLTGSIEQLSNEVSLYQRAQIDELHDLIVEAEDDLGTLAELQAAPVAAAAIFAAMQRAADMGIDQAAGEATRQGVQNVDRPGVDELAPALLSRAEAVDTVLARSISEAASRKALALTGGALIAAQVAAQVQAHLSGLTGAFLTDQLGGAVVTAMNGGRKLVMARNKPQRIYASELLDANTCEDCVATDGTEYESLSEAEIDYPTGGNANCQGGPRCRGTVVAQYDTVGVS